MKSIYKHSPAKLNVRGYVTADYFSPPKCNTPYEQDVIRYAFEGYSFILQDRWRPISLPEFAKEIAKVYDCEHDAVNQETVKILSRYPLQVIKGKRSYTDPAHRQHMSPNITSMIERNLQNGIKDHLQGISSNRSSGASARRPALAR